MFKIIIKAALFLVMGTFVLSSCVPQRKYEELKTKQQRCAVDNETLKAENEKLTAERNDLKVELEDLNKRIKALVSDTNVMGKSLRTMTKNYDQLDKTYELLLQKNRELLEMSAADRKKMMNQINSSGAALQQKQDELKKLSLDLEKKKSDLDKLTSELKTSQEALDQREKRVKELEELIAKKDAAVNALKDKVADALLSFKDKGLTVEQKNGKVYVSMEAKLLFPSGSTSIDKKGKDALVKLAKVLEDQTDIGILVEGHTDTDKISSSTIPTNNWELSVLRATAVVQIMLKNSKMNPAQLTAAGRSEFLPVDQNDKAKNRRIEIILTPKLDELFEMISNTSQN